MSELVVLGIIDIVIAGGLGGGADGFAIADQQGGCVGERRIRADPRCLKRAGFFESVRRIKADCDEVEVLAGDEAGSLKACRRKGQDGSAQIGAGIIGKHEHCRRIPDGVTERPGAAGVIGKGQRQWEGGIGLGIDLDALKLGRRCGRESGRGPGDAQKRDNRHALHGLVSV